MKHLVFTIVLFSLYFSASTQTPCTESFDFSSNSGWTQVGTNVQISNGKLNYLNGATCSSQRRVYRTLDSTLNSGDAWSIKFELYVDSVGQQTGQNMTGVILAALTAGVQDPLNNCPNISCTNYPTGIQDGIMAIYGSPNPGNGLTYYNIKIKDGSAEYTSPRINCNIFKTMLYLHLEKATNNLVTLNIYSDSLYSIHVPNSPVSISSPSSVSHLNTLQHGNVTRGSHYRQFWGFIDNVCLNYPVITSLSDTDKPALNLSIYPNPTSDLLHLKGINTGVVQLFDLTGKMVFIKENEFNLSLGKYTKGIYLLKVSSGSDYFTKKIILK